MPDILNTSLTGMRAFQRALNVTSHNIANANTPGYSRQVTNFSAREGTASGIGSIGVGVRVASIERVYDALQTEQLRSSSTGYARLSVLNNLSGRVDSLLADSDTGLNSSLQSYFDSLQDLASTPASVPARQALIGESQGVVSRFQSLDVQLDRMEHEVNDRVELAVDDINRLANSIADVNQRIAQTHGSGSPANDLLDERDILVLQLSEQLAISTHIVDDGTMSVFIGSGQSLVLGSQARQLGVAGSEFDQTRASVFYQGASGNTPLAEASVGGNLGGLLEFRTQILDETRQSLGETAIAFAMTLNTQHASGMDLRGKLGGDLFNIDSPTVLISTNNSGTGSASATVTDLGALTGSDYVLEFDGSAYNLTRASDNVVISLSGAGTAGAPFVGDGLSIVVGGAPSAGDRLLLRSSHDAAGSIQSAISDPHAVALAAPTRSSSSFGNIGDGIVSPASVVDPADPALLTSAVIEFTGAATYSINGAGSFAYAAGAAITLNGSSIVISGTPLVGDRFSVEANYGASGDNGNALMMANAQATGLLDGGLTSIGNSYAQLVSTVGSTTHQIQSNVAAQGVVLSNAHDAVSSVSAVNLDEEAANLIKFQQAYQAIAQVIRVASTLFDTLLGATRR